MEAIVWLNGQFAPSSSQPPERTESILVLRNGDYGDLLVITPLFQALHELFPNAQIVAGIGDWNVELLKNNPYVSEILPVNAPWHNKFVKKQSIFDAFRYVTFSPEVKGLRNHRFDIGIDVLGSTLGSLLMVRAKIPYRLGVKGFAGGQSATQGVVNYDPLEQVGRTALRFAEMLGAKQLPPVRPQIYLTEREVEKGKLFWDSPAIASGAITGKAGRHRIVVGIGAGFTAKAWPCENFQLLSKMLINGVGATVIVVGGREDEEQARLITASCTGVVSLAGQLTLRETFSLVSASDLVISNSSMLMHVAAAFSKPSLVLLGESIASTRQHVAQWGYDDNCYMIGKDVDHPNICAPEEAFDSVRQILSTAISSQACVSADD
jgi:ADP-heptose:LPS heptosyltransferase